MKKITENTLFVNGDESLGMTMLDFWKYQYSNIYDIQEYIAEFIVGKALGINEPMNRDGWTLWDIDYKGKRIEVKQTSYYHSWQEKIANGKISQQRTFSITPAFTRYRILQHLTNIKTTFMSFVLTLEITKKIPIL